MDLHAILVRAHVNKLAAHGITQRRPMDDDPLTADEIRYLMERIARKSSLLKKVMGIHTRAQLKNLKLKHNKGRGWKCDRLVREPRAWAELRSCGEQMLKMQAELSRLKTGSRTYTK